MKEALQVISFAWPVVEMLPTSNVDTEDGTFKHDNISFKSLSELVMFMLSGCVGNNNNTITDRLTSRRNETAGWKSLTPETNQTNKKRRATIHGCLCARG